MNTSVPAGVVRLAPANMAEDYLRLEKEAQELFGPNAKIICDNGNFWIQPQPFADTDCLGSNGIAASRYLLDVYADWKRHWQELAEIAWNNNRGGYTPDEAAWLSWWHADE